MQKSPKGYGGGVMVSWRHAVVHPLGLAGYALACVFGLLAKFGPIAQYPWLVPVAIAMAIVALIGGLLVAWRQVASSPPGHSQLHQQTQGPQSPTIANVKGHVSIDYRGRSPKSKDT